MITFNAIIRQQRIEERSKLEDRLYGTSYALSFGSSYICFIVYIIVILNTSILDFITWIIWVLNYFLIKTFFNNKLNKTVNLSLLIKLRFFLLTRVIQLYIMHIYSYRGGLMNIFIDNKSGIPIYDQIYTQVKNEIISGNLSQDEALPSIRNLAKDLRISVITTKRAYDELEREGFIYTLPAKGCFVAAKNLDLIREDNLKKIESYIEEIQKLATSCNLSKKDIIDMFNILEDE